MSFQHEPGKRIDCDSRGVAFADVAELRLFVVRLYPHLVLDKGDDLCARVDELTDANFTLADNPVGGRDNARVFQVRAGHLDRLYLRSQVGFELRLLRVEYGALPLLRLQLPLAAGKFSAGLLRLRQPEGKQRMR